MAPQEASYWLNRDFLGSPRTSYQHHCLVRRQGYLIDPTIASATDLSSKSTKGANTQAPIQIADIATGNGIWALETCASLDTDGSRPYQMTALDISDAMFPSRQAWPTRCIFDKWDVFEDVPEQYIEKFDIVHTRFLIPALMFAPVAARERAVRNMTQMVKPSGWFQWQEPSPPIFPEVDIHDNGTCSFRDGVPAPIAAVYKCAPTSQWPWVDRLGDLMKDIAGFEEVKSYYPPAKREFLHLEVCLSAWSWDETMEGFKRAGVLSDEAREEVQGVWDGYATDLKKGTILVALKTIIAVGRKSVGTSI